MLLARRRCDETIGPLIGFDIPEPSRPRTPPAVRLRIFRMNFVTNVSRCEAQSILNGWTYDSSEQYPYSERMLFCDSAAELGTLFPRLHQKFRRLVYLDHFSHIHMKNISGPVVEGTRTQASFILQKWRRRVIAGFSDHHPWVAGVNKSLLYIPKYECRCCYFLQDFFDFLRVFGFIVDPFTPEAAMNVITRGLDRGTEEIKERSDLPPLPNAL
jgi:hypothetical protein